MEMDEEDKIADSTVADDDDLNTTAPNAASEVWKMPEPVFRRTSGKLPRGYEKTYAPSGTASAESAPENESNEPNESVAASEETATTHVEPAPKNPTMKLVLVFLGIAAMIAFIVVFLTVVYFFFWRSAESSPL